MAIPEWKSDFKFITSGRGIQTRSGKLLHCMVNLDHGMHLFESDEGEIMEKAENHIKSAGSALHILKEMDIYPILKKQTAGKPIMAN